MVLFCLGIVSYFHPTSTIPTISTNLAAKIDKSKNLDFLHVIISNLSIEVLCQRIESVRNFNNPHCNSCWNHFNFVVESSQSRSGIISIS